MKESQVRGTPHTVVVTMDWVVVGVVIYEYGWLLDLRWL